MVYQGPTRYPRNRGYTLLEIVVVVAIMAILGVVLLGGYGRMQKNQRLANSAEKVLATIHMARSLAISNNAIYHLRIEDYEVVNGMANPVVAKLTPAQCISVYCYPSNTAALRVIKEPHPTSEDWWSPHPTLTVKTPAGYGPALNVLTNQPFDNYRLQRVKLEPNTYLGVQDPVREVNEGVVLSFFPDGTASENVVFYVTDDEGVLTDWNASGQTYPPYDDKSKPLAERQRVAELRRYCFNETKDPLTGSAYGDQSRFRMFRVLRGGLIKQLVNQKERL